MDQDRDRLQAAAQFLREARVGDWPADLPEALQPRSLQEGYLIQDLVVGDQGVAGWKILATAAPENFSCAALAAPDAIADGGDLPRGERKPEVEVEVAVQITRDLPPGKTYTKDDILSAIGAAHVAFEIVESRFNNRKAANPLAAHADAQSSRAMVIGSGTAEWQGLDLPALDIVLTLDGVELARKCGGASAAQVVEALVWLANHAAGRAGLKAGQHVITGARIGPLVIPEGQDMEARIEGIGAVSLRLV